MHAEDVDKETRLPNARPCPFCGGSNIWTYPGSTFRWRYAGCGDCGAQSGEVRMNTLSIPRPEAIARANDELIAEWNRRTPPEERANTFITPEMLAFLHGCGTLEGVWFGEKHPVYRGQFWWRRLLPPVPIPPSESPPQVERPE